MVEHQIFPDRLDEAQQLVERRTEQEIARVRAQNAPEQVMNADGTWPHAECVSCGDDIPEGRLALGKIRCVICQSKKEQNTNG